jgi:sugar phosphate isomerase/epimerase
VNIVGSLSTTLWDGYAPGNYSRETYENIIRITREIIDDVKPEKTCYSLEPMPWMVPDSPEQYLQLMQDMDRDAFKVHLDFANMINGVERYHDAENFIRKCFRLLGPHIRSIHLKDVQMGDDLPCCIREILVGKGALPLNVALEEAEKLGPDTTVFTEHYDRHEDYVEATAYLRDLGWEMNINIK